MSASNLSSNFDAFRVWLNDQGGGFCPSITVAPTPSGLAVVAESDLERDTTIVTCPFELIITKSLAEDALKTILGWGKAEEPISWSARQWISSYICFHWILGEESSPVVLAHYRYLATLPSRDKLRTPLYFTPEELPLFRGTNLFGAALDKEREWKDEWTQCRRLVGKLNPAWGQAYTWDYYLSAATYLSSRAFPSSLLSPAPTLEYSPSTEPVLIPGVDALNHARGEPVSWSVIYPDGSPERHPKRPYIALVHHNPVRSGQEIFNNYGAKPNSEFILGYGFALPHNPEDTIVLKIGGIADGQKWEVGRNAANAEGLWNEILTTVSDPAYAEYENMLDSAGMLTEMVQTQLDRLPQESELDVPPDGVHPEVVTMLHHYLKGQREILEDVMQFASTKEQAAVELARSQGIDVVLDD